MHEGDTKRAHLSFAGVHTANPCALAVTEAVLTARLRELGEAVTSSVEVTAIDADSTGATLTYTAAGCCCSIRAGWVIGCDGLHSVVRQTAGIGFESGTYDENFVLSDVEMDFPIGRDGMDMFFSPEGFLLVVQLLGNRYRVIATRCANRSAHPQWKTCRGLWIGAVAVAESTHPQHGCESVSVKRRVLRENLCGLRVPKLSFAFKPTG